MIASLLRLFALRPFLTMGILGFPILLLIAVGLLTILVLKVLLFIVFPLALVIWILNRLRRSGTD